MTRRYFKSAIIYMVTLFSLLMAPVLMAATKAGIIISTSGNVTATANGKERMLSRRDAFYQGDTIKTAKGGSAKLKFTDNSTIRLKSNSSLKIKTYAFNGKKSDPQGKFDALLKSGGLRAASGLIPDQDYSLETPVAIIGIRGTAYDVMRNSDGTETVQVLQGTISVTLTDKSVPTVLMSANNFEGRPDLIIIGERGDQYTIPPKGQQSESGGAGNTSSSSQQSQEAAAIGSTSDTQSGQGSNQTSQPTNRSISQQFTQAFTGGDSNNGRNETNVTTGNQAANITGRNNVFSRE